MSVEHYFLDINILGYTFGHRALEKRAITMGLVEDAGCEMLYSEDHVTWTDHR